MGLYKRGSVWWMSFTYKGKFYRKSTEANDRKLAQKIYDKIKGQIAEGKWFDVSEEEERTFKNLVERYMEEHSKPKKRSWLRDEISISHLEPSFGSHPLGEITPEMISKYKAKRYAENARPATINRELALGKHAYNLGLKEWGWCKTNPFSMVKMEKENNGRDRILTYEEENRLLSVCPKWLYEIVTFALYTGARMGEILELTWKDVDLFRKVVVIHQGKTGQTKTIPLTATALEVLKRRTRVRHLHSNLVFPSQNETRISNRNLERAFTSAMKKVQIAYSDPFRPLILIQSGHPFRCNPATDSDSFRPAIPIHCGHP